MSKTIKQYPIPPIIQNMLERMWNEHLAMTERDNVALMLDEIERAVNREVSHFRKKRATDHVATREQKRKRTRDSRLARVSTNLGKY